jgi:hypothetical protein
MGIVTFKIAECDALEFECDGCPHMNSPARKAWLSCGSHAGNPELVLGPADLDASEAQEPGHADRDAALEWQSSATTPAPDDARQHSTWACIAIASDRSVTVITDRVTNSAICG